MGRTKFDYCDPSKPLLMSAIVRCSLRYTYTQVNAQRHYSMVCTVLFLISPGFVLLKQKKKKKMYCPDEFIAINCRSLDDKSMQFYRIVYLSFYSPI